MAQSPDETHYEMIADRILDGAVVPFLGAGVNLCGRPDSESWQVGRYLPSGSELAAYLASKVSGFPGKDRTDLLRVSQYVDVILGKGPLYELLHTVFDADYAPTPVHELLASLPSLIRARPSTESRFFPLIVTTNYDDLLERAFKDAEEEYDVVTYIADGPKAGRFLHTSPDGVARVIGRPNSYTELGGDERPVIAKIHGAVGRGARDRDSFVITENHYIEYLSRTDLAQLIPVRVAKRMRKSHFLFLGYSLKDWNLRVILNRLWGNGEVAWNSWAVQLRPDTIDERSWYRRGVELLDARLEDYIEQLSTSLANSASATAGEAAP
jgi:hypothetical protein